MGLFLLKRCQKADSLYWLLREPLVNGARLDVSNRSTPGLMATVTLKQLVDAVGPALNNTQALGSLLGLQSTRVAQRILELWTQRLSKKEQDLLRAYQKGEAEPDAADPYPEIILSPGLGGKTGPLLTEINKQKLTIRRADKETFYRNSVKAHSGRFYTNLPSRNGQATSSGEFYTAPSLPRLLFLFLITPFLTSVHFATYVRLFITFLLSAID